MGRMVAVGQNRSEHEAFLFQAEDGIRCATVTGVQTCALPIYGVRLRQPAILTHLDDDLAFCAPRFEVSPSLFGGFEREDPIHDLPDDARFNEGCDLAQL